jgi:hypothetical protein
MAPSNELDNYQGRVILVRLRVLRAMELGFARNRFSSNILFQVLEFIAYFFRVKAEPRTDAHKRIRRMLITAEEPSRRLLGVAPLLMRRERFLKTE